MAWQERQGHARAIVLLTGVAAGWSLLAALLNLAMGTAVFLLPKR